MFISDSFLATFQSFLASIAVVIGSAGAIQLIDFLRQKRLGWDIRLANKAFEGGRNGRWTALVALFIATIIGMGTITSGDPYIAHLVGFLMTESTRHSIFATANLGVIVSMLVGASLYAVLTFVCNIALPGLDAPATDTPVQNSPAPDSMVQP